MINLNRVLAALFVAPLCLFFIPATYAAPQQALSSNLAHKLQDNKIIGFSIAVIENNKLSFLENSGFSNKEKNIPVTDNTLFSAASLSKTVFSYIVMQLVDEHKIDLDTPLYKYFPEKISDNIEYKSITARIVLSHKTGFPDWRPKGEKLNIYFTPGERFSYSGEGYVYLQKAVEHIEKLSLNTIAQKRVFEPLGMVHSTYVSGPVPNAAQGYDNNGNPHAPFTSSGNAAYSLLTTNKDYALFLQAIMNGKGLSHMALHTMESPQSKIDTSCTYCTEHPMQHASDTLAWGLCWGIETINKHAYLWHWGDNTFFKAFVYIDQQKKNAVVYFTNSENGLAIAPLIIEQTIGIHTGTIKWLDYKTDLQ